MLSLAKNDRGIRLVSGAILFLPVAAMIMAMSKSGLFSAAIALGWLIFACVALIAFLYERSEEDELERNS